MVICDNNGLEHPRRPGTIGYTMPGWRAAIVNATGEEQRPFRFVGRDYDVITSSGYRIGPFEVESTLMEHPAVAEAAVIGRPDRRRTEVVKAYLMLSPGTAPSEALAEEIGLFVKRFAAHAYPRKIEFVDDLPKTPSGKVQRFVLRQQEISRQEPAQKA